MKIEEYALEATALLSRIKNTATMINSYVGKFHHTGLLQAEESSLATSVIRMVDESPIPRRLQAMYSVNPETIDTSQFEATIAQLERRLKTLNRICMQFQDLHAMFVKEGKLK